MNVSRRSVFLIGGYDPQTAGEFFGRMSRELRRFETTWGLSAKLSPVAMSANNEIGAVLIETRSADWTVATHFSFLVLDSVILRDLSTAIPVRLLKYLVAFADYAASGAFAKMARKAWRFALFFAYPFAVILFCAIPGFIAGMLIGASAPRLSFGLGAAGGLIVFALALYFLGGRLGIFQLMDLWAFSRNFLRGRRPEAEALLDRFAAAIVAHARQNRADELILIGHSIGGGLILDIAARCLAIDPQLSAHSGRTAVLTVGSIALALGMHPAAKAFRNRVQTLADDPRLEWVDVQCMTDPINFYKSDPMADMGLKPRVKGDPPLVPFALSRMVQIREMLEDATYQRIKRNLLRVHYQYLYGATKRYFYDFFMICCGPTTLAERMMGGGAGDRDNREIDGRAKS